MPACCAFISAIFAAAASVGLGQILLIAVPSRSAIEPIPVTSSRPIYLLQSLVIKAHATTTRMTTNVQTPTILSVSIWVLAGQKIVRDPCSAARPIETVRLHFLSPQTCEQVVVDH